MRYYYRPISTEASAKEKALAVVYIEKFSNGTFKRGFLNGTIAVYHRGFFVKYDVKPIEFYTESTIEKPIVEEESDGSRKVFFTNGTVRYFESASIISDKLYMDCYENLTCVPLYKNGTKVRHDDGVHVSTEDAPAPVKRDPTYKYVDKTGPKM